MNTSPVKGRLRVLVALVIGLMFAGGVWQQRDLHRLRLEHGSLLDLARNRGIDPSAPDALPTKPYPRRDMRENARALAGDLIDRATKKATSAVRGDFQVSDARWSPDGTRIAYVTSPTPKADDGSRSDVFVLTVSSGDQRKVSLHTLRVQRTSRRMMAASRSAA